MKEAKYCLWMSAVIGMSRCCSIVPLCSITDFLCYFSSLPCLFNPPFPFIFLGWPILLPPCCPFLPPSLYLPPFPSIFLTSRLCALCCGCAEWLSGALQAMEEMDSKPYQPLSKGRHEMEMSYTSSSDESEDGRAHHRSYTSRETLPDYTHELRLTLGSHRERQSNYSQPQPGTSLKACLGWAYWPENIYPQLHSVCTQMDIGTKRRTHVRHTHMLTHTLTLRSLKGPMWITYYSPQWARRTVGGSQLPLLHGGDISLPQLN